MGPRDQSGYWQSDQIPVVGQNSSRSPNATFLQYLIIFTVHEVLTYAQPKVLTAILFCLREIANSLKPFSRKIVLLSQVDSVH